LVDGITFDDQPHRGAVSTGHGAPVRVLQLDDIPSCGWECHVAKAARRAIS
jgi:hypothetical protein